METRNFPASRISLFASEKSAGRKDSVSLFLSNKKKCGKEISLFFSFQEKLSKVLSMANLN